MSLFLSSKLRRLRAGILIHWCPGCELPHPIHIDDSHPTQQKWCWNGSILAPTFTPSVNVGKGFCHYWLRDGVIQFLPDCHHGLAGTTVPLPDFPPGEED